MGEIEQKFVSAPAFSSSISRVSLWQQLEQANALLTSAVSVHAAWISGSFLTDKPNPRDVDVVYIVSESDRAARSTADQQIVESFIHRVTDPATGQQRPRHGLQVDSFIVDWDAHHQSKGLPISAAYKTYGFYRGYWDDLWSRRRVSPKTASPVREDALPVRGYLEVMFDDFQ